MRLHVIVTGYLLVFVWLYDFFRLSRVELAVLLLAAALVWAAELINTSVERLTDLASPDYHPLAGLAKDLAAAAVLTAAFFSVLIGMAILWRPWAFRLIAAFYHAHPRHFLFLLASLLPSGLIIGGTPHRARPGG